MKSDRCKVLTFDNHSPDTSMEREMEIEELLKFAFHIGLDKDQGLILIDILTELGIDDYFDDIIKLDIIKFTDFVFAYHNKYVESGGNGEAAIYFLSGSSAESVEILRFR